MSTIFENSKTWCLQYNCHSVGIARKIKDGKQTKQPSITFFVEKKLPISSLGRIEIIPPMIGNYKTDVVEQEIPKPLPCFAGGSINPSDPEHPQAAERPLRGGVSVGNMYDGFTYDGTLGQLCIDQEDGTVVGLSNHHVLVRQYEKNAKNSNASTVEYLQYPDYRLQKYYNVYNKPVTQPAPANPPASKVIGQKYYYESEQTSYPPAPSQGLTTKYSDQGFDVKEFQDEFQIGYVKRFIQPSLDINNVVDSAICSINNDSNIIPNSNPTERSKCFGIRHIHDGIIPWATDQQMNTLREEFINGEDVYVAKTGRTTGITGSGYKDGSCPVSVFSMDFTINLQVNYTPNQQKNRAFNHTGRYRYSNLISFAYADTEQSNGSLQGGDSGSALVTNFFSPSGTVIGLCFAGGGRNSYAAPIDAVRSELNVDSPSVEDMQSPLKFSNRDDWKYVESDTVEQKIVIDGKTYWNIGTKPQDKS